MAANIGPIVIVLIVAVVILLILVLWLTRQLNQLRKRVVGLTRGEDGDLGDVLGAHLDRVYELGREVERLGTRTNRLETAAPRAFQRVGLVRFNPFEDTGGNQSFALALLDADGERLGPLEPPRPHRDTRLRQGDPWRSIGWGAVGGGVRGDQTGDGLTG